LENQQLIYYNADDDVDEVLGRETLRKTPFISVLTKKFHTLYQVVPPGPTWYNM
jgi:hypothetical protein